MIFWLEPGNPKTLTMCSGCKNCREAVSRSLKNSKLLTKQEKKVLIAGGFRRKDFKVNAKALMKCAQEVVSEHISFLKTCLNVQQVSALLLLSEMEIVSRAESNPPKLLGLRFQSHWLFSRNQFHLGRLFPNFKKVLSVMYKPNENMRGIANWLDIPNVDLQTAGEKLSPREWLIRGLPLKPVLEMAKDFDICP